ncbi:MAG: hypothetical protein QME60_07780 [Verrucomicrobiota bacterium]|nr:hypothetical protein [Verrucomicrobiota bacterium]
MKTAASWMLVAAALACLWLAGRQNTALARERARGRAVAGEELENAPPVIVFTTVALGGFRGLIADLLWLRATDLQDEGRYVELVQLADWITKLEPHSAEIWAFHAWNLAYNVSVMMPDDEDRWRWVKNGIRLLRNEGVAHNPGEPELYAELAWLFMHKIGKSADQAHAFYKQKWAEEMTGLLGGPRPDYDRLASESDTLLRMRKEYALIPGIMKEIEAAHGPLDWTRPETHALYWAHCGRRHAGNKPARLCDMIARQSLQMLAKPPDMGPPPLEPGAEIPR